jgi:SsrA-binding protein
MRTIKKNKKWLFNYEVSDTVDAGIILQWHEVKSIKLWNFQISDSHIKIDIKGNLMLYNLNVPRYAFTSPSIVKWYDPKQPRQLLITKQQRIRMYERTRKTWLVMIPIRIWESKTGYIKVTVGLAKRKKKIQKRSIIKDRDTARQMDKAIKNLR